MVLTKKRVYEYHGTYILICWNSTSHPCFFQPGTNDRGALFTRLCWKWYRKSWLHPDEWLWWGKFVHVIKFPENWNREKHAISNNTSCYAIVSFFRVYSFIDHDQDERCWSGQQQLAACQLHHGNGIQIPATEQLCKSAVSICPSVGICLTLLFFGLLGVTYGPALFLWSFFRR